MNSKAFSSTTLSLVSLALIDFVGKQLKFLIEMNPMSQVMKTNFQYFQESLRAQNTPLPNANTLEDVHRIFIALYVDSKKAKAPGKVKLFI